MLTIRASQFLCQLCGNWQHGGVCQGQPLPGYSQGGGTGVGQKWDKSGTKSTGKAPISAESGTKVGQEWDKRSRKMRNKAQIRRLSTTTLLEQHVELDGTAGEATIRELASSHPRDKAGQPGRRSMERKLSHWWCAGTMKHRATELPSCGHVDMWPAREPWCARLASVATWRWPGLGKLVRNIRRIDTASRRSCGGQSGKP